MKARLEADSLNTYSFIMINSEYNYIDRLIYHFRDASVAEIIAALLAENLNKIKDGMASPQT